MDTKKRKGPKPIAARRSRIHVTLPDDDLDVLKEFCSLTGVSAATFIRQVVHQALPDIKKLVEATKEIQSGGHDRVASVGATMLAKYINEASQIQQDMFDEDKK